MEIETPILSQVVSKLDDTKLTTTASSSNNINIIDDYNRNNLHNNNNTNNSGWTSETILDILYTLSNWLRGIESKPFNEEEYKEKEKELWKDWEWILSTTEEFVLKQNQLESVKVLDELDKIKKTASNLKLKPLFIKKAAEVLKSKSSSDIEILKTSLDSNKRSAVLSTVINTMEEQWLQYIKDRFFYEETKITNFTQQDNQSELVSIIELAEEGWEETSSSSVNQSNIPTTTSTTTNNNNNDEEETKELKYDSTTEDMIVLNKNINRITWEQFFENFKDQQYSKGINGRMKEVGWIASHGFDGSLNSRVIGDITWSIWNTLNTAIKQIRELSQEEHNELIEKVAMLQPLLVNIWLNTKLNSRIGVKNEGIVVEKWKKEESNKKKKILELKKSGLLERYSGEKTIVLAHERKEISSLRTTLEQKLKLRYK
eukprot:gene5782-7192_t